jgi:RNA polymerase primary sigma factor
MALGSLGIDLIGAGDGRGVVADSVPAQRRTLVGPMTGEGQAVAPKADGRPVEDEAAEVALSNEAAPIGRTHDELVARCLDDLIDDWQRKGGTLSYTDVTRMSTKRGLDGRQLASLLESLADFGVTVEDLQSPGAARLAAGDLDEVIAEQGTVSGRDSLGVYLAEIGRYPLLWPEDEVRLGRLIRAGQEAQIVLSDRADGPLDEGLTFQLKNAIEAGRRAHDELVLSNLRLVVSSAKQRRYIGSGVDLIDRIQDGNIGLMRAADKFDYTMGYKFSTYAMWWIRQSIERGLADRGSTIRLPVHFRDRLLKVTRARRRLSEMYDREPTLGELALATDLDPGMVQGVLDWVNPVDSLDRVMVRDGDLTLGDLLDDKADVDGRGDPAALVLDAARLRDIDKILDGILDARSASIIRRRFGIGRDDEETLQVIADDLHVTRERVRQLEVKALEALGDVAAGEGLYEYLVSDTHRPIAQPPDGWKPPTSRKKAAKQAAAYQRYANARDNGIGAETDRRPEP